MLNPTAEVAQTAATAAADSKDAVADPALFARELGSWLAGSESMSPREKMGAVMERLAAALPGTTITTRGMASFSEVGSYYVETGLNANVNISADTMAKMADDEELFNSVRDVIEGLFKAGESGALVNAGGNDKTHNINITNGEVRYVEVQRGSDGTTMSVASLALQAEKMMAETLQRLFESISTNARSGGRGAGQFQMWNANMELWNLNSSSSGSGNWNFGNVVSSTNGWRFEMLLNDTTTANRVLQSEQQFTSSLEVIIEQYEAQGGSATGMDLYTYMEINGLCDPLVLDLGGEGINLTSAEDGVYFDIKGDGSPVQTAFIKGNNAFLYLDENGNGVADDVHELFGDTAGYENGFEKLRQYDDNGDGIIDENDAIYSQLRLWRDLNGDGVNQIEESLTLAEAGVKSINLNYNRDYELDRHGNVIGEKSSFTRTDGSEGLVADVWLKNNK